MKTWSQTLRALPTSEVRQKFAKFLVMQRILLSGWKHISSMIDNFCSIYDWLILFKLWLIHVVQFGEHLVIATFLMPNMIVRLKGGDDFNCSVRWGPYLGAPKDLSTQSQHETSAFKVLTCSSRQTKRPPCWHLLWATLLSISTSQQSVTNKYLKYGQAIPQTFWF